MKVLVCGGSKSGKSKFAQKIALKISDGNKMFYVATMIPKDEEDKERIRNHIFQRSGLGFKTVECFYDFKNIFSKEKDDSLYFIDSITAMLANIMFKNNEVDFEAEKKLRNSLNDFIRQKENIVFVSDIIFNDAEHYSKETEVFRKALAKCSSFLAENCDVVVFAQNGNAEYLKGKEMIAKNSESKKYFFITGGAYNGKMEYAKKKFNLTKNEICICSKDDIPDFSKRCIAYVENYVWYCLEKNIPLKKDWPEDTIFICTDIFCGVVPVEKKVRLWREESGKYFQFLAEQSTCKRIVFSQESPLGK